MYSSSHAIRRAISEARKIIAEIIGDEEDEIIFTSGGTEADNWALKGILFGKNSRKKIITSTIEHHAILNTCSVLREMGYEVIYLPVDRFGMVSTRDLENVLDENVALVSIMYVNNEIGTIQNIAELSAVTHRCGALFHTDAVQAIGHIGVDVKKEGIDLLSASAHKFNGPKGIGFLYVKAGVELAPLITGGSQEFGKRAGTENVAGIVGMSVSLKENFSGLKENMYFISHLEETFLGIMRRSALDFCINANANKIPGNISLSFFNVEGEVLLHRLDLKGIEIATGSACDSQNTRISHVIRAIGVPEEYAKGTIRISFGKDNTEEDIEIIAKELIKAVKGLMGGR